MNKIKIYQEKVPGGGICVYANIFGEHVILKSFGPKAKMDLIANIFQDGAEAIVAALDLLAERADPQKVAEVAAAAAREAGVDESIIAQGGVAVGPFGATKIPSVEAEELVLEPREEWE